MNHTTHIKHVLLVVLVFALVSGCSDSPTGSSNQPTSLQVWLGDSQTGIVAQPLGHDFVVRVTDASGHPVECVTVNFTVVSGGGTIQPSQIDTDRIGIAGTTLTTGPLSGLNEVCAFAPGLDSVVFSAYAYHPIVIDSLIKEVDCIQLRWHHQVSEGFKAYEIYRMEIPDPFFAEPPEYVLEDPSANTLRDYSAIPGVFYYYRVVAEYTDGLRIISDVAGVTPGIRIFVGQRLSGLLIDSISNLLYVITYDPGDVTVISPSTFGVISHLYVGQPVACASLSTDGSILHLSTRNQDVLSYATENWTLLNQTNISEITQNYLTSIYTAPDNRVFLVGPGSTYASYILMMEPEKDYLLTKAADGYPIQYSEYFATSFALVNPPGMLFLLESTNRLYRLNLTKPGVPYDWIKITDRNLETPFFITPDGSALIFSNGVFVDADQATTAFQIPVLGRPVSSCDKTRLYFVRPGMLTAVDMETFSVIDSVSITNEYWRGAVVTRGDTLMWVAGSQYIEAIDLRPFVDK